MHIYETLPPHEPNTYLLTTTLSNFIEKVALLLTLLCPFHFRSSGFSWMDVTAVILTPRSPPNISLWTLLPDTECHNNISTTNLA